MRRLLIAALLCSQTAFGLGVKYKKIDLDRLKNNVEKLTSIGSRFAVDENHKLSMKRPKARDEKVAFIEKELQSYGYSTRRERFTSGKDSYFPGTEGINIVAFKKGRTSKVIELGAHYDTAGVAGADDNISGTVGVIETARLLALSETESSIRFILYDLEEIGLAGSMHHVENLKANSSSVHGAYVFEMIGYTSREKDSQHSPVRIPGIFNPPTIGDFILVVGNLKSVGLAKHYLKQAKTTGLKTYDAKRIGVLFKDSARSDHKPYWDAKIPAIMITDTANFRNPHYHKHSDEQGTLDFKFMSQVIDTMVQGLKTYSMTKAASI